MSVLITGATGFIGSHLACRLIEEGHDVVCSARDARRLARRYPGCDVVVMDFAAVSSPDRWFEHLTDVHLMINAAGCARDDSFGCLDAVNARGAALLFEACLLTGVDQILHLSAFGADGIADTPFHRSKKAAERALAALDPSGVQIDRCVLRPAVVCGAGAPMSGTYLALAAQAAEKDGKPFEAVLLDDLAGLVLGHADQSQPLPPEIDLVGPDAPWAEAWPRAAHT